jgi:predicted nucleic acid-binding protein
MTIVIADTSPLNYLVPIDEIAVLPRLYRRIVIPPEVRAELSARETPAKVVAWIQTQPGWLETRAVTSGQDDPALWRIDTGERAAIREFLDLPTALTRLAETNFRADQSLIEALLAENANRRRG